MSIHRSPVEAFLPVLLRICDPLPADAKLAILALVLIRFLCDWTELNQGLEILELLFVDMQLKRRWLLLRARRDVVEGF
jgi:hypothetical protein